MKKILFIFIFSICILNGAILRFECDPEDKDISGCYYRVALSYAFVGNSESAIEYCEKIVEGDYDTDSFAYGIRNNCYKDVAKKLLDLNICEKITQIDDAFSQQKEICIMETEKEIERDSKGMKCTFISGFIIGIALFGSFLTRFVH